METTQHVVILAGLAASQVIAMGLSYWMGRQTGERIGMAIGHDAGTEVAYAQLLPEIDQAQRHKDLAERELGALRRELWRVADQLKSERLRHAESLAALRTRLDDALVPAGLVDDWLRQDAIKPEAAHA